MSTEPAMPNLNRGYWQRARQPLQSLVFLLPLLVLYEIGARLYATNPVTGQISFIYARSLLRDCFQLLGVTAYYLPGLLVVAVLLGWHVAKRDPWRVDVGTCVLMLAEALVLAVPLFVFAIVITQYPLHNWVLAVTGGAGSGSATSATGIGGWQAGLVNSIGAGIYEELLFRLIAIALVHMLLVDVLALPESIGAGGAVIISALAFAFYHLSAQQMGQLWAGDPLLWERFMFYIVAGVYFAAVFVLRGFGIVAGTHATYDVLVVLLPLLQGRGH